MPVEAENAVGMRVMMEDHASMDFHFLVSFFFRSCVRGVSLSGQFSFWAPNKALLPRISDSFGLTLYTDK